MLRRRAARVRARPAGDGAACTAILERCDSIVDAVNYHLLSDLAVCADLAMATVRCGAYNVRANLADIPDETERRRVEGATTELLTHAAALIQRVAPRIWARHGQGA